MDLSEYFSPVPEEITTSIEYPDQNQIAFNLMPLPDLYSEEAIKPDLVFIGVPEGRGGMDI